MFSSGFLVFPLDDQRRKDFFTADELGLPHVYCYSVFIVNSSHPNMD